MSTKKYMSLERLTEYDGLIKTEIAEGDAAVKSYVDTEVAKMASSSHNHDDRYYTETEVDTKISGVNSTISTHTGNSDIHVTTTNKSNWNSAYTHSTSAHAPSNAEKNIIVGIQKNGTDLTVNSSTRKVNITVPTTAAEVGAATSDHKHDDLYDAKGAAAGALSSAQAYADSAATKVKNDLLNGAGTAYDTLKELGELIVDNADAIDALETIASGKADATHSHAIADVSGLQSALDGKAASSHGTHVSFDSTNKPKMDGTAAFGTSSKVARADHVHPTDTSRASQADLDVLEGVVAGKANTTHSHAIGDVSGLQEALDAKDTAIEAAKTEASNQDAVILLEAQQSAKTYTDTVAAGKANVTHSHAISDVSGLQTALNNKADASHGTHVTWSTTSPKMNGTASVGSETKVARGDHVHPTDTSRASKTEFDTHVADTTKHITSTERTNWNAAKTHADSAHAPSNAQANVIESIKVNGTAQTISSKSVNITVPTKASDIGAAASSHGHEISEITNLQSTLTNAANAISANTGSITALTDRTKALEDKVGDGFEEITSEEIRALFAN